MDRVADLLGAGIFQYSLCLAGTALILYPDDHGRGKGYKGVLQPLLRKRAIVWIDWWALWAFSQNGYAEVDEKQGLPVRIFDFLFCYVLSDALEYMASLLRGAGLEAGGDAAVGV